MMMVMMTSFMYLRINPEKFCDHLLGLVEEEL